MESLYDIFRSREPGHLNVFSDTTTIGLPPFHMFLMLAQNFLHYLYFILGVWVAIFTSNFLKIIHLLVYIIPSLTLTFSYLEDLLR